jgi:SAM-dependent methyltransferase
MILNIKKFLKNNIPTSILVYVLNLYHLIGHIKPLCPRTCPICNYHGPFSHVGFPLGIDSLCPKCFTAPRHRLFYIWLKSKKGVLNEPILHFAPEIALENIFRKKFKHYQTADLITKADLKINIENIELEQNKYKTIICNHVLEHVNDKKALKEMYRIVQKDGYLITSVPIIEGWDHTYENPKIVSDKERNIHFGQADHLRFYGSDFRKRFGNAGFKKIEEYTATGKDVIDFSLNRGEKIFICKK